MDLEVRWASNYAAPSELSCLWEMRTLVISHDLILLGTTGTQGGHYCDIAENHTFWQSNTR